MCAALDYHTDSMASSVFYRRTRDLHLYLGLFLSPFVLVYAISAILLNHAYLPWGGRTHDDIARRTVRVIAPDTADGLAAARAVRQQVGVHGEIGWVSRNVEQHRLEFPIETPGHLANVRVDLATGIATVEERETGVWDAAIQLHKLPGPHLVKIRGNWPFTRMWGWLADATVYGLLFLTASGIYLWLVLRAERRAGLLCLGAGAVTFLALLLGIVA